MPTESSDEGSDLELDLSGSEDEASSLDESSSSSDSSSSSSSDEDAGSGVEAEEEAADMAPAAAKAEEPGADDGADDPPPTQQQLDARREETVRALVSGSLNITRKPILPKLLSVADAELQLKRPFKSPHPNAPARSEVRAPPRSRTQRWRRRCRSNHTVSRGPLSPHLPVPCRRPCSAPWRRASSSSPGAAPAGRSSR